MKKKLVSAGSLALILFVCFVATPVGAAQLGTAQLIRWSCPVNLGTAPPAPDPDGSRTLMHVIDAAGNDFKIRCIRGALGFHYEYYVSFPSGAEEELSECIYPVGFNDATLIYTGALTAATGPTGTPILTVGSIQVVEHSNVEGQGLPPNIAVKPGGRDFHIVHDYRNGHRYRINTVGGRGTSTDILAARLVDEPGSSILRAGYAALAGPRDFAPAMAGDLAFRKLDHQEAEQACEDCTQVPAIDDPAAKIGFADLTGSGVTSLVLFDPELRGTEFRIENGAVIGQVPGIEGRQVATLAFETGILPDSASSVVVELDGEAIEAGVVEHEGMIRLAIPMDAGAHKLRISSGNNDTMAVIPVVLIGVLIAVIVIFVIGLSRRGRR